MINLKSILVATDFSDQASAAVRYAAEFARLFEAETVACHVLEPAKVVLPGVTGTTEAGGVDVEASNARDQVEQLLTESGTPRFRVLIEKGNPSAEIIRAARNEGVDLIVLSTHGRTGMSHMIMGSTAENVVRLAPCPVLVVRDGKHAFQHPSTTFE